MNCSYVTKINPTKILPLNIYLIYSAGANMASLLKHFHHKSKQKPSVLPDLKGSLSEKVASLTNSIVHNVHSQA